MDRISSSFFIPRNEQEEQLWLSAGFCVCSSHLLVHGFVIVISTVASILILLSF